MIRWHRRRTSFGTWEILADVGDMQKPLFRMELPSWWPEGKLETALKKGLEHRGFDFADSRHVGLAELYRGKGDEPGTSDPDA